MKTLDAFKKAFDVKQLLFLESPKGFKTLYSKYIWNLNKRAEFEANMAKIGIIEDDWKTPVTNLIGKLQRYYQTLPIEYCGDEVVLDHFLTSVENGYNCKSAEAFLETAMDYENAKEAWIIPDSIWNGKYFF